MQREICSINLIGCACQISVGGGKPGICSQKESLSICFNSLGNCSRESRDGPKSSFVTRSNRFSRFAELHSVGCLATTKCIGFFFDVEPNSVDAEDALIIF